MTDSSQTPGGLLLGLRQTRAGWAVVLLLVILSACGEGESELFDPGSGRDLDAPLDTLDLVPMSADRTYRARGETGVRSFLPLIREGGAVSTVYLRFDLEDLPDTSSIVIGKLSFRVIGGSGDPVRMQLFEVAPEAVDWREDDLPLDPLPLLEPELDTQTGSVEGTPGTEQDLPGVLEIPAQMLRRWKSDPGSNRGVALRLGPQSSGFLVLYSSEAVVRDTNTDGTSIAVKTPELVITRTDEQLLSYEPDDDAYIVEDGEEPEAGDATTLGLEQLVPHRTLLLPDTSATGLRRGDTVHKAELFVQVVPGSFQDTLSVGLYRVLADWSEGVEPDTLAREAFATDVVTVNEDSDTLRFDFAPQLQRWIDGNPAYGLVLRVIGEGSDDLGIRIFSREGPSESAPYFRIISSPAPDARWEDE